MYDGRLFFQTAEPESLAKQFVIDDECRSHMHQYGRSMHISQAAKADWLRRSAVRVTRRSCRLYVASNTGVRAEFERHELSYDVEFAIESANCSRAAVPVGPVVTGRIGVKNIYENQSVRS